MKATRMQVSQAGFFTILGLLLAVVIVLILYFSIIKLYFKQPAVDRQTEKILSEQNIDTSSRQAILDSTRRTIRKYEKRSLNYEQDIENMGR